MPTEHADGHGGSQDRSPGLCAQKRRSPEGRLLPVGGWRPRDLQLVGSGGDGVGHRRSLEAALSPSPGLSLPPRGARLPTDRLSPVTDQPVETDDEPASPSVPLPRWVWLPLSALAAGSVALYVLLAVARLRYPYELEWMEGGSVDHVRRILGGESLYVRPSVEFVPYIYTPLYFYAAAVVAKVVGVGFVALRLVSFAASVGVFLLIFLLVRRETDSNLVGLLSCGLFAATFRLSGAWFDIARVDSLFLLLLLASAYLARFSASWRSAALAGAFAALSFLTKQVGLLVAVALAVFLFRRSWRHGSAFVAVVATTVVGTTLLFNRWSGGWYNYYVFELPREHEILREQLVRFWSKDLLAPLALALAFGAFFLLSVVLRRSSPDLVWFYVPVPAALVAASWIGRLHSGGYDNVLIPAYAAVAILFGLGAERLLSIGSGSTPWLAATFLLSAVPLQFATLAYDPFEQVPSRADRAAGRELTTTLESFDGEVWMPAHGHFTAEAGKGAFAQGFAMLDVMRSKGRKGKEDLMADIASAVASKRFAAVIVDSVPSVSVLPPGFDRHYQARGPLFRSPDALYPVTGAQVRPETVYLPRLPS